MWKKNEVKEFRYLRTVLFNHGEMEGKSNERVVRGGSIIGKLARVMKGRNVSVEEKKILRSRILLPMLTCGSEMWT